MRRGYFHHQEDRLLPASGGELPTSSIRRRGYFQHQEDRRLPESAKEGFQL
jgi:hypothetical protein